MNRRGPALIAAALALLALRSASAGVGPTGEAYVPIAGCRAVDTRGPTGMNAGPALAAGETRVLTLTGVCGVPANALGLVVNVAAVAPAAGGFATLYAGDAASAPGTSVLNFNAGKTRASNAMVALASDGSGTVKLGNVSVGATDFVVDIQGYWVRACTATITVTNPATATGTVETPFSQTFTSSGGTGTMTFATASPLPAGLTLAPNGTLSGTPTQSGTFPITVVATDANGCTGTGPTYTLVIACQTITVTNPGVSTGTANVFFSQTFTQAGGVGTTTFATVSALPIGMTLSAGGVLSGTPTQAGGFDIVVTATDANGCTGAGATYHLVIACQPITVTNPAIATGTASAPFSQTFTQAGAIGSATFTTASALPAGLNLAPNGVLSGTPLQTGSFPIVVTVTDGNLCVGSGATYNLVIGCQTIAVTNPATTTATIGTAFSQTFTQVGAVGGATFTTASTLPSGMNLSTAGVLSGTPGQTGSFPIVVTVTDANGCTGTSAPYTLVVSCQTITLAPATLPQGTTGTAYATTTFTQTGGIGAVTFGETGALPNGINFSIDTLSGTPTEAGSFPITITATDSNGCTASRDYLLVVACSGTSITLSPSALPTVLAGSPFPSTTFTASGGTGPYAFAQAGALPTGMSFAVDTLSGTPTQTGTFPITVSATDSVGGCVGSQDYVVTVTCNGVTITVAPPTLASGPVGSPYGPVTFTPSGGTSPYTLAETGALPAGMTFASGVLSGTPTQAGTFPIVVTATDAAGCSGATSYSFVTVCPTITVTNPGVTTGTVDAPFSQTFTQTGVASATFSTTSPLPNGLTLAPDGTLSGTPEQTGAFPIVVKATDANGCTGTSATYTLVISCQTITVTNPTTATGTVDTSFSQTFTQTGAGAHTPVTFTTASPLPPGLTLTTAGVLTGTPTAPGTFPIHVTATDANGCSGTGATYTLVISCQSISVTNPLVTVGTYSTPFSQTFTQTGVGTHTPATFTTANALPTGLTLSSAGVLSGTPIQTGSFPIVVTVTDANGCTGTSATYTLAVGPKLTAKAYTDVGNTQLVGGVAAPTTPSVGVVAVSAGDTSDTTITYAVTVAPAHGTLTAFNTNGTFLYTPNAGNTTADSFTYTGASNGVAATQTATIGFSGMVWYVDNASGGSHDGRSNTPFLTMTAVGAAATSNGDFVYVAKGSGSTTGAYVMKPSQQLIGAGATLNVPTVGTLLSVAGNAANTPTLSGTLTLASSVVVNGIDMSTGSSGAIAGSGVTGVSVTARSVATTTGTAVSIGGSGNTGTLTFTSVSANGAANGISVSNLTGSFTVAGAGGTCTSLASSCSGGTIQNTTGHAVFLSSVQNPSLSFMKITNVATSGVYGTAVTNFTLANSVIDGVNTSHTTTDADVAFNASSGGSTETNVSGAISITNNTLNNSWQDGISILNYAGTISSLTITGNSLTSASAFAAGSAGSAIKVLANQGAAGAQITAGSISGNTIHNFPGGGGIIVHGGSTAALPAVHVGSAGSPIVIDDNVITGFGTGVAGIGTNGIEVTIGHLSSGYFTIGEAGHGNSITNVAGNGVACSLFGTGTEKCSIAFNTIDANNTVGSPGINTGADSAVSASDTPTLYLDIHDNNVSHTVGNGILSTIRSVDGTGIFHIQNNIVARPTTSSGTIYGIRVDAGNGSEATGATVCLKISGNTTTGSTNGSTTAPGIGLRQNHLSGPVSTFRIDGLTPASANDAQMEAYVGNTGQNPGSADGTFGATGVASISAGATFTTSTCTIP